MNFRGFRTAITRCFRKKGEIAGAVFGRAGSDANSMEEYMNDDGTVIPYETFEKFMAESNVSRDLKNNEVQMLTPDQAKTCARFQYEEKEVTLKVGDKDKEVNSVSIFPASGTMPPVRFKSDNTDVVTVSEDGKVTAVGEGTATIKMIATDFSGRNTSYTITVTK